MKTLRGATDSYVTLNLYDGKINKGEIDQCYITSVVSRRNKFLVSKSPNSERNGKMRYKLQRKLEARKQTEVSNEKSLTKNNETSKKE